MSILVNADSSVAQIGAVISAVADNTYTGDGVRVLSENNGDTDWRREPSSSMLASGAKFGDRLTVINAGRKFGLFRPVEGIDMWQLRGGAAVFAATIYADASIGNVKAAIVQWTGVEDAINGDPVTAWNADGVLPTLAAGWSFANAPVNLAVPAATPTPCFVTGTIAANATNLAAVVWNDDKTTTAGDSLVVSQWILDAGSAAPAFEPVNAAENLARCQRYAIVFDTPQTGGGLRVGGYADSTTQAIVTFGFSRMRVRPSGIVTSNPGDFQIRRKGNSGVGISTISLYDASMQDATLLVTVQAPQLVAGEGVALRSSSNGCTIELTGARL